MEHRNYDADELDCADDLVKVMNPLREQVVLSEKAIEVNRSKIDDLTALVESLLSKPKATDRPKKSKSKSKPKLAKGKPSKSKGKGKKKGTVRMKTLVGMAIIALLFVGSVFGANITFEEAAETGSLIRWLNANVSDIITSNSLLLTPTDTEPDSDEGRLYYNDSLNKLQLYNGTAFVTIDTAGGVSLDSAYDYGGAGSGRTITATDGAVQITNTENDTASLLGLTYSGNTTGDSLTITMSVGSGDGIEFENTGTGYDIEGTGALWYAPKTGVVFVTGLVVNTSDLTFNENSAVILNDTNNEIEFQEASEVVALGFGTSDTLEWSSDTGIATVAWGDLDAHTGLTDLTGDAADFTISTTGDATGEDLILQQAGTGDNQVQILSSGTSNAAILLDTSSTGGITLSALDDFILGVASTTTGDDIAITQTGAQDASIILTAAGTGIDAISLQATAGAIDMDAQDNMFFDLSGAGANFDVDSAAGSIYLDAGEAAADAITIAATTAGGGIDITSNADIDITTTGAATEDITITNTGGSIIMSMTENVQNGFHIEANGGTSESINLYANQGSGSSATTEHDASIQLQSDAGGIGIYSTGNVADTITLETNGGTSETIVINNLQGTGTDAVTIKANAAGGDVDIDSVLGSIYIEAEENHATAVLITADGGTTTGMKLHNDTGTGDESILLASDVGGITMNAAAGSIDIEAVGGGDGDIGINAGDDMTVTVAGDLTYAVTGAMTLPDDVIRKTTVAVTAIQADNLRATPKELVAAEAGKMHEFVKVIVALDWGATAYTESDDNLAVRYENTTGVIVSDVIEATGLADATEDTVCFAGPAPTTSALVTEANSTNKALVLHGTGNGEWGNSGDSPLVIITYYRTHTTAELGL